MSAPRQIYECGNEKAYQAHWRRGEPIDDACRLAHNATMVARRANPARIAGVRKAARADAIEALIHRHPDEFRQLYRKALAERRS